MDRLSYENVSDIHAWLIDQPLPWVQAIACRASLRVLPLLPSSIIRDTDLLGRDETEQRILATFRANYMSWVAMQRPLASHIEGENSLARSVNDSLHALRPNIETAERVNLMSHHSMSAALGSVTTTAVCLAARDTRDASEMAARTLHEAMFAVQSLPKEINAEEASQMLWRSFMDDLNALASDADQYTETENALARVPLWLEDVRQDPNYVANLPLWARIEWDKFAQRKLPSRAFRSWIAWYRSVLPNKMNRRPKGSFGEDLDVRIASMPDKWWSRGALEVEQDIAAWRSDHAASSRQNSPHDEHGTSEVDPDEVETETDQIVSDTSFLHDAPTSEIDELDRASIAFVLAGRINQVWEELNKDPGSGESPGSFVVHVDAPWGGGKTTFAHFLSRILNPYSHSGRPPEWLRRLRLYGDFWPEKYQKPWHVVKFNAWQHQHVMPPWWVLYQAIWSQGNRALGKERLRVQRSPYLSSFANGFGKEQSSELLVPQGPSSRWSYGSWWNRCGKWVRNSVWEFCWRFFTPTCIRNLGFAVFVLLLMYLIVSLAVKFEFGFSAADGQIKFNKDSILGFVLAAFPALIAIGTVVWGFLSVATSTLVSGSPDAAKNYALGIGDPLERVRRHFIKAMHFLERPVLVVIDDLDRCDPKYVVELIRGMQTVLKSPRVIFLILGDRDWFEHSFSTVHAEMEGVGVGPEHSFGARFAEKAVQFSFVLPSLSHSRQLAYVQSLLGVSQSAEIVSEADGDEEDFYRELDSLMLILDAEVRDGAAQDLIKKRGLEGNVARVDEINRSLAQRAAADETVEKAVRHHLEALASVLPANPRQIKRIINAISLTQEVARIAENIQPGDSRWQVLALWIVLMTEWPKTWFTLSTYPGLLGRLVEEGGGEDMLPEEGKIGPFLQRIRENSSVMKILEFKSDQEWWARSAIGFQEALWLRQILPPTSGELLSVRLPE